MKLETSRDILLPKVKGRLCLLKIDRPIQTDFGIQLNVVLFSFLKKQLDLLALKCHHDQLPPTSYSPIISKLEVFFFKSYDDEDGRCSLVSSTARASSW